jgi:hypothetical protein
MLDIDANRSDVIDAAWPTLDSKAALPANADAFFDRRGPMAVMENSQRRFHRYFSRTKALLQSDGVTHGIYIRDISRSGVGFISPVQLFPRQRVCVQLLGSRHLVLENVRCRRLAPRSYECGAMFVVE